MIHPIVYLALNDECSFIEYPNGLRIEAFLSLEEMENFIASQMDSADWETREVPLHA